MRAKLLLVAGALAAIACGTSGAQGPKGEAPRAEAPVKTAHPYVVDGKVQGTGGVLGMRESVKIGREGAPPVVLHVADGTQITLGDKPAHLSDLREGDEVRATFDFDGASPIALEIHAKKGR